MYLARADWQTEIDGVSDVVLKTRLGFAVIATGGSDFEGGQGRPGSRIWVFQACRGKAAPTSQYFVWGGRKTDREGLSRLKTKLSAVR
jgi:hypothetical protein